jgi:phosphoribosylglycinamide formyltransferase-1
VLPDDSESSLANRVLAVEHHIYPQALQWLADGRIRLTASDVVEIRGLNVSSRMGEQQLLVPKEQP